MYQALVRDEHLLRKKRLLYELYYDEAHFIKEFKRFMGHSPARYSRLQNDVGKLIYCE